MWCHLLIETKTGIRNARVSELGEEKKWVETKYPGGKWVLFTPTAVDYNHPEFNLIRLITTRRGIKSLGL